MKNAIGTLLPRRGGLAWGTAGTLVLNTSTTLLNFALAVLLARLLGAEGYGAFAFALAWAVVLEFVRRARAEPTGRAAGRGLASPRRLGDASRCAAVDERRRAGTSLLAATIAALCGWCSR